MNLTPLSLFSIAALVALLMGCAHDEPEVFAEDTRAWLDLQRDGSHAEPAPGPLADAQERAELRYLESFSQPLAKPPKEIEN